jgi:predicted RNase H-like HicB family nuclease
VPSQQDRVATGATVEEMEREIAKATRFHVGGLKEEGVPERGAWSMWRPDSFCN